MADSSPESEELPPPTIAGMGCVSVILLLVLSFVVGRFLGAPEALPNDAFMQVRPGTEHTLNVTLTDVSAFKGLHQVVEFDWSYEPMEGPADVFPSVRAGNTEPWVLGPDQSIGVGPGGIPLPGQRPAPVISIHLTVPDDAPVGAKGSLHYEFEIDYATWELGQAVGAGVVNGDIEIISKRAGAPGSALVEVVSERTSRRNVWDDVSDWLKRIGVILIPLTIIALFIEARREKNKTPA